MNNDFIIEDLRANDNALADLRILYSSGFALLVRLNTTAHEASICGFERNKSIIDLIIPSKVNDYIITSIGKEAFDFCLDLRTVIIPDSITTIEDKAFYSCPILTTVTIPSSVSKIGVDAFGLCVELKTIVIDNPSLLDDTGISKEVDIQSRYTKRLLDLFDQNVDAPNNPEFIKLCHSIAFSPIIDDFADTLDIRNVMDFNNVLLKSIKGNQDTLLSVGFGFVKYLHIFNHAGENNIGSVNLCFDYPREIITNNRDEIGIENKLFDDDSLISLIKNDVGIMGGGLIEYCTSSSEEAMVLSPYYYPIVFPSSNQYQISDFLKEWFKPDNDNLTEASSFLLSLDTFIKEDKSVTNVFYLGNYGEQLDRDYSLWANVGIDCTNVKDKNCVKAFLDQLRQFLHRISVQIQVGIKRHELREKAVRSAVGQVSIRNFSHNFGSHVFSKLMGNDTYYNIEDLASNDAYISCYKRMEIEKGEQLAYFLQYVKNRMDYLSELTFYFSNMLFSKNIYGDVFKELDRVRLLLNYISGVSTFKYKFRLMYNSKDLNNKNDIAVAFPSDVLGSQAFYNIIENLVRNTAKHAMYNVPQN